jgi:hypothetical protein
MPDEVLDLLDALQRGDLTLTEVAQRFRERRWPRRRRPSAATYEQLAERDIQDPEPYLPGSFDDVAAAYHRKQISREQFRVLSEAVAESQRAEDVEDLDRD